MPIWAIHGKRVWVEIRDKQELDVLEYLEGTITKCEHEAKVLMVQFTATEEEKEIRGDRIHERLETHGIVRDLADIPLLNDAELLKHLELRYKKDMIHCYCGPTLVVINPYKNVDHENSEERRAEIVEAIKEKKLKEAPPHVWTLSATAYEYLFTYEQNQAICISGESGAGKTESTKRCLEFITNLKHESKSLMRVPIEDKIMSCNPVLEAFGNSKTFRNDNSSRFGKYTILYVHKIKKSVKGASIENYLLEKSRISALAKEERNYHIFYAFCRFASKEMLARYKLLNDGDTCNMKLFNYLNQSGVYETPKINDKEFYDDVNKAFNDLDFSEGQRDAIWRTLSTILHLGNLEVDDSQYIEGASPCTIKKSAHWKSICELLEINENDFEMALTHKELRVANTVTKSPLSKSRTQNNVDSIAKEFYNRMFNWIVTKLNKVLHPENLSDPNYITIGVLDIFGFEIFDKNSLEQFFINYANEKLQGLYIEYIFKNECSIFESEGLGEYTSLIQYTDNKSILLALDNPKMPPGVFDLVDQTCALNKNDENLHAEIVRAHKTSEIVLFPKFSKNLSFIIKHTARDVEYLTDNFVEKNKDELSLFLQKAVETSHKEIVAIFNNETKEEREDGNTKRNPKEKYLGYKFRKDMNNLIGQLSSCFCHFVRCIKPNEFKRSDFWSAHLVLMQIRYMGLLDSLKVRKMSYPFRFDYSKFFEIYQDLDMSELGARSFLKLVEQGVDFKDLAKKLASNCGVKHTEKDLLYGTSKIFLNEKLKVDLDRMLTIKQKQKKDALHLLQEMYNQHLKRTSVEKYFVKEAKSVAISRDLLNSCTAKVDGMKFRNLIETIRKLQRRYRLVQQRKLKLFQAQNMKLITQYLGLFKFHKLNTYILQYKRKILVMQAMLDKKIKDAKNRFAKGLVLSAFENAWSINMTKAVDNSILDIQRTFRSHLRRKACPNEHVLFQKRLEENKVHNTSSAMQKVIRGHLVRDRLVKKNRAAVTIQNYFRTVWMRRYYLKLVDAVLRIQKFIRRYNIRKVKINEGMSEFLSAYGHYNQKVAQLEYDLLFNDNEIQTDATMPFHIERTENGPQKQICKTFIPQVPNIELNPKVKLFSVLVDLDVHIDTSNVYSNTWANEFLSFIKHIHEKESRLLHLEVGESFTVAVTDDKEVYIWGTNDYFQCARQANNFSVGQIGIKNLSINNPKLLSAGKDHGIMVDDCNNIYVWGKNDEGQLGLGNNNQNHAINVLAHINDGIKSVSAKEGVNYVLTGSHKVYSWPSKLSDTASYRPIELSIPENVKIMSIDVGSDFSLYLSTTGLLYSMGSNSYGELGIGESESKSQLTIIRYLRDQAEKVVEMSCGFKHAVCKTALNRIFTWGNNANYQLGLGDNRNRNIPFKVTIPDYKNFRYKARSVQAGLTNTIILMEDKALYVAGTRKGDRSRFHQNFERLVFEDKVI